jgi:DNA-3-methyladenine glycosylase
LCQAFNINRSWDGIDLTTSESIWIVKPERAAKPRLRIASSVRIGVTSAKELPLRYFIDTNRFVSGRNVDHSQRPNSEISFDHL